MAAERNPIGSESSEVVADVQTTLSAAAETATATDVLQRCRPVLNGRNRSSRHI